MNSDDVLKWLLKFDRHTSFPVRRPVLLFMYNNKSWIILVCQNIWFFLLQWSNYFIIFPYTILRKFIPLTDVIVVPLKFILTLLVSLRCVIIILKINVYLQLSTNLSWDVTSTGKYIREFNQSSVFRKFDK